MNYKQIDKLLESFYAGETTLEEEDLLRDFFRSEELPEKYQAEKIQFTAYQESFDLEVLDEEFDKKLLSQMEPEIKRSKSIRRWAFSFSGVAAAALVVALLWADGFFRANQPLPGTINNPELAFAETRKAFMLISKNLNQGLAPVQEASSDFSRPLQQASDINLLSSSLQQASKIRVLDQTYDMIRPVGNTSAKNENK
ncbi:MAG: hypothetical protein JXR65_07430 [Bacteroidales bacterium]|nr:hypothetical protein [Bacteroidales bacterium]